ncbi:MAG: peptide ABC transporter substrate-binding protein [Pseudomonadota bacterium]
MTFDRTMARLTTLGATLVLGLTLAGAPASADNVLRIGNSGEPDSLDPHQVSGNWEDRIVGDMFMGLTTEAADGTVIPGAAESWTISDDGLTYTFNLRDHTWSDGTPVTADDFVFALQRILDPATAAEYAYILYPIKNAEAVNTGSTTDLSAVGARAVDPQTLEVTLERPTSYFVEQLTHYTAFPVPKHKVEELGDDWVKPGNIVGNGAYTVTDWLPNSHVKMVKSDTFWDADNVAIGEVHYFPTEERNAGTKQFRAGELDVQYDFASEQIDFLKENLPDATRVAPELAVYYYPFNTTVAPFDDPRIRQALAMAIDRGAITEKVLRTGEVPAYSFVPPNTGAYGEPPAVEWSGMPYEERVEKAKELLAEAGYGPDNPLQFVLRYNTSENHKKVAIAVAAMWKKLGVEAELFNTEVKVHYNDLQEGDFEVARAGWVGDYNDPENFLSLLRSSTGPMNYGQYNNADYDRLMDESDMTADADARNDLMKEAEAIMLAEMPVIPIYHYVSKNLVSPSVQGWVDNAKNTHRTRWLTLAE